MVNLLLVSHSKKLADGVAELTRQMAPSESVQILTAAGIGEDNAEIGTNALEIMEALQQLSAADGILVLMDLGSALLSAEMALDMLDDDVRAKARLCPAPFVEGAIAAGVQANMGSDLQTVYAEAMRSLLAKQEQIGLEAEAETLTAAAPASPASALSYRTTIANEAGLHARPASVFAKTFAGFDAKLRVTNLSTEKGPVDMTGIISVMLLGAKKGHELLLEAEGPQATELLAALKALFDSNFGED